MLRAALFDVDGTLVDSNALHAACWAAAFRHFGKDVDERVIFGQLGKGGDQLVPVFLDAAEEARIGAALRDYRTALFTREYLPRVRPFAKVRALFERLRDDGYSIALASSAPAEELATHVRTLDIADLLAGTTSADDAPHSKPCPDVFEAAARRLDVPPHAALVVGDTPYDAIAARRAGMRAAGVLSGGFASDVLHDAGMVELHRDVAGLLAHYDRSVLAREAPAR